MNPEPKPVLSQIPFDLVERHKNKTTQLLANSGTATRIDSSSRWHEYEFKEPLFISFIRIVGEDLSNYADFKIKATLADGKRADFNLRPSDGTLTAAINEFCTKIAFKPPSTSMLSSLFAARPELTKVVLWGFQKSAVSDFLGSISKIDSLKNQAVREITSVKDETDRALQKLANKESQLEDVNASISESQSTLKALELEIVEKRQASSELTSNNASLTTQSKTLEGQIEERKAELATATQNREDINLEVERAKTELKKLQENINLFPSEVSGFVDQASRDINTYMVFAGAMVLIIASLFIWVLTGAFDLSEFVKANPSVSIWPLFLAKLPLAITVSALVAACYKITRVFIEELLKINRQKLSLTQVSIIAKDTSTSAEAGLELTQAEIYGLRLRTKMALLSDHIKTFVPTDAKDLLPQTLFDPAVEAEQDEKIDGVLHLPSEGYGDEETTEDEAQQ